MAFSIIQRVHMLDEFKKECNQKKSLIQLAQLVADQLGLKKVPSKNTISLWIKSEKSLRQQASAIQVMFPGPI